METLEFNNYTFCKAVKKEIVASLSKIKAFKKVDNKEVRLLNAEGKTVALWSHTSTGSKVIVNSFY